MTLDPGYELAVRTRERLVVGGDVTEADIAPAPLDGAFRRSLHIRHVDAGSDGAVEQEIAALLNPYYDMQRLGLFFTASPRHADVLLVTGPVTAPMEEPLRRTYDAMPEPRVVVAAGTDACSGSIWTVPRCWGASTGCCRLTSTFQVIHRVRSHCSTGYCLRPAGYRRHRRRARARV